MRLDKFLQVSRIIKRRSVSKEIIEGNRVFVNEKIAKPGLKIKAGDLLRIKFGDYILTVKVIHVDEKVKKEDASLMYEIISKEKRKQNV